jgi:hypothetical protein
MIKYKNVLQQYDQKSCDLQKKLVEDDDSVVLLVKIKHVKFPKIKNCRHTKTKA